MGSWLGQRPAARVGKSNILRRLTTHSLKQDHQNFGSVRTSEYPSQRPCGVECMVRVQRYATVLQHAYRNEHTEGVSDDFSVTLYGIIMKETFTICKYADLYNII